MSYASKIILQLPIADDRRLAAFVEACIKDKVALIAVVGDGCDEIEDQIDGLLVGDGSDGGRFLMTTSLADQSVEEAIEFVRFWKLAGTDEPEVVKL